MGCHCLLNKEDQIRMHVIRNFGEQLAFPCFFSSETPLFFACTRTGLVLETTLCNRTVCSHPEQNLLYISERCLLLGHLISFLKCEVKCYSLSCARLFVTPWTAAHQAPLSIRLSRQGYWSGLPFPSPGDFSRSWYQTQICIAGRFFTV